MESHFFLYVFSHGDWVTREIDGEADKFVDPNGGWFNTHTGNVVISGIPKKIKAAARAKSIPVRFETLFALTYALWQNRKPAVHSLSFKLA